MSLRCKGVRNVNIVFVQGIVAAMPRMLLICLIALQYLAACTGAEPPELPPFFGHLAC